MEQWKNEPGNLVPLQPWISDTGPKVPQGWGLDVYRGKTPLVCESCCKPLKRPEEYLYKYTPEGTIILHNKKECYEGSII
ncbi:hypothetical protein NELLIE_34 [Arthrobacter phage Nellie]|uniref:Uncharacterized protein n=4 Tax=Jasminevirus adat TaxID=2560299 RepID=A0A249XN72_9CAUD|nr:hypothetical protein FDI47_gp34 [Arthrobacter phage Adat]ASZ72606.1 hypothetical protein ADAT_34 [Arthrobacter phage Adat]ASZ73188.1 hypothetical protein GURGLEFERB_34 [Arthrobacter phage GurgleFerb]ASZ73752.1 hypothetical protein NELLIE_34 [Arthrobacter phage Nellie]AXH43722.1 hypothetical protein SEA_BRAD_34 [Arthrobacter phage Brad]